MKKVGLSLVLVLIIIATSILMFACSGISQSITYNDTIESKYGDSFIELASTDAPGGATEYINEKRVTRKILIDGRVKGSHMLALYAPRGEEIELTIDAAEIANGHSLEFNENGTLAEVPFSLPINKTVTTFSRTLAGGMLEFNVAEDCSDTFEITIKGAVDMPHYRYGLDDSYSSTGAGNYALLDCTNVRIYINSNKTSSITQATKTMNWWRNAVTLMDELLDLSFWGNDYSPMRLYVRNTSDPVEVDVANNSIYFPNEYANSLANWDYIYADVDYATDASIYNIIRYIAELKVAKSGKYQDTYLKNHIVDILTRLTYINMIDESSAFKVSEGLDTHYVTDAKNTALILSKEYENDTQRYCALFTYIYYNFSRGSVLNVLDAIEKDKMSDSLTLAYLADMFKVNLIPLADKLNISLYGQDIEKMGSYDAHVICANSLTFGRIVNGSETGNHVRIGEKQIFDFASQFIADGDVVIEGVLGQEDAWVKLEDGTWQYTANQKVLKDTFTLVLKSGDNEVKLIGGITVDIDISEYALYENVSATTLSDAIKEAKNGTPTKVAALSKACIPEEEVESAKKSFAVAHGAFQVKETGYYTLYLKSAGLCNVSFGVEEYSSEIFNNFLTVPEYTSELSYTAKLEKGIRYIYTINNLANQGIGYAQLGIKYGNTAIEDIDNRLLVYSKLKRDNIVEYEAPQYYVDAMNIQNAEFLPVETVDIAQFVNIDSYEIGTESELIEKDSKVSFVLPLVATDSVNYVQIETVNMEGVNLTVYGGVMYKSVLATETLVNGLNIISCEERNLDSLKFEFISKDNYRLHITKLEAGECISAMTIIPSSSTQIEYIAEWDTSREYVAINGRLAVSSSKDSELSYSFNGNEISIYATKGPSFGSAKITIDGQDKGLVDLNNAKVQCAQLVFNAKLKDGQHTIKISAADETPINIDYLAVAALGETKQTNDYSKLWYISFIPGIILIAGIVFFILDIKEKKKRTKID